MPPIDITFHFPPHHNRHNRSSLSAHGHAHSAPIYITIDKPFTKSNKAHRQSSVAKAAITTPGAALSAPSPPGTASSSSSTPTTATATATATGSRRKGPVYVYPTSSSSKRPIALTPLLKPIVARCSASASTLPNEPTSHSISPPRKKAGNGKIKSSFSASAMSNSNAAVWPLIHPYSRSTDLANTRSSNPSPKEIARAQKAEEEKARAKKESAALARAAVAAKRKSKKPQTRGASRVSSAVPTTFPGALAPGGAGSGSGSGIKRRKSDSPARPLSPEKKGGALPTITAEPALASASNESSPSIPLSTFIPRPAGAGGLKRTRSQGVLPIFTGVAASVGVGSPLKAVLGFDNDEEEEGPRKRSKLVDSPDTTGETPSNRRANTHSPVGTPPSLPDEPQVPHTFPLPAAKVLPRQSTRATSIAPSSLSNIAESAGGASMRRVVSAGGGGGGGGGGRKASFGSDASGREGRERSKREVNLPNRLRDYDMRAAGAAV